MVAVSAARLGILSKFHSQSGDFADSVTAVQNLAAHSTVHGVETVRCAVGAVFSGAMKWLSLSWMHFRPLDADGDAAARRPDQPQIVPLPS